MTLPVVKYQDTNGNWQDISAWVRSYSYTTGRQTENTGTSPGQATIVLDNNDGKFVNATGSVNLFPKATAVRIYANGSPRYTGYVVNSPLTFGSPEGTQSTITLSCTDNLGRLQRMVMRFGGLYATLISASLSAGPCAYWPLNDPVGSVSAREATGRGYYGALVPYLPPGQTTPPTVTYGVSGVESDDGTSVSVKGAGGSGQLTAGVSGGSSFVLTNNLVIGIFFKGSLTSSGSTFVQLGTGLVSEFSLFYSSNQFGFYAADDAGHSATINSASSLSAATDGNWHSLVGTITAAGAMTLYLDDAVVATGSVASFGTTHVPTYVAGAVGTQAAADTLTCGHLFVLSNTTLVASNVRRLAGLYGNTSTQALTDIVGVLATGTVPYSFDTQNNGTLTPVVTIKNSDLLTIASGIASSEDGPLFCKGDGTVTNLTHASLADRAVGSPAATFVNGDVDPSLTFARDDQGLYTDIAITSSLTGNVQYVLSPNLSTLGDYALTATLNLSDAQALDFANWKSATSGSVNYSRINKVDIDLMNSVDIQAAALGLAIGSRFTMSGLPSLGGFTSADVIIQGFTESWDVNHWTVSFNTTPSSNYQGWVLEDATYGLLDTSCVLYY